MFPTRTSLRTENIRFGLAAVKNVGGNAIESIVAARKKLGKFKSIFEFCENVDLRLLNKRVLESLVKSGAMDSLGRRAQLMAVLDKAMEQAQKAQRDAESGQHGLFGVFQQEETGAQSTSCPTFPTGMSTRGFPRKKKSSASSSPAIRWRSTKTSCRICRRSASKRSPR